VAVQAVPAEEEGVAQENGWMAHGHQNGKKSNGKKSNYGVSNSHYGRRPPEGGTPTG
jgi:hypothetical protein